ncbi:hypothetical protein SAEN111111_00430 [Saccharibacillus endophyticus]
MNLLILGKILFVKEAGALREKFVSIACCIWEAGLEFL